MTHPWSVVGRTGHAVSIPEVVKASMKHFCEFPHDSLLKIRYVLTDIDDTLTLDGKLPAVAYSAMERLQQAGVKIIPITGRPAGWCDHIARMWPIEALVGENGAFYFRYDSKRRRMVHRFWRSEAQRIADRAKLKQLEERILLEVSGCQVSADQPYRETDLAIDFDEDVDTLTMREVKRIVNIFEAAGAKAKISSIHVNGWFGEYDKLAMTQKLFSELFEKNLGDEIDSVLFIGDSPNDASMFAFFPNSVGVANILRFTNEIAHQPTWVTEKEGGLGFAEMANALLLNDSGKTSPTR